MSARCSIPSCRRRTGLKQADGFPPKRRFAVYRNNVCVGLVDALAERFPICLQLVGDEFFRAMAQCYVRERLPRTPMLFEYGDAFAAFVSEFEPARELPYLPDVARLEYAVGAAYHAADAAPLPLDFLRALSHERLDSATAVLHPSTHVVASAYPIVSIWRRHMSDDEMTPVELEHGEEALVVRPELAISVVASSLRRIGFRGRAQERKNLRRGHECGDRRRGGFRTDRLLARAFLDWSLRGRQRRALNLKNAFWRGRGDH